MDGWVDLNSALDTGVHMLTFPAPVAVSRMRMCARDLLQPMNPHGEVCQFSPDTQKTLN